MERLICCAADVSWRAVLLLAAWLVMTGVSGPAQEPVQRQAAEQLVVGRDFDYRTGNPAVTNAGRDLVAYIAEAGNDRRVVINGMAGKAYDRGIRHCPQPGRQTDGLPGPEQ